MRPDSPRKEDYEYERCGTCSLLLAYDLDSGRRYLQVRERRTKADYAEFWDWLITTYYADTPMIQVIQDNLNTHTYGSFYEHLSAQRAHGLKNQLRFHFTPKHGSWLNMAEMELSVLVRQCLDRRLPPCKCWKPKRWPGWPNAIRLPSRLTGRSPQPTHV